MENAIHKGLFAPDFVFSLHRCGFKYPVLVEAPLPEARLPNRSKSSRETRQRLGTNNIPTRSMGFNKRRNSRSTIEK